MLKGGKEIIIKFAFETTMTRAASIQDDEISVTDVLGLSPVIEQHPKQPNVIPKAFVGRAVHT